MAAVLFGVCMAGLNAPVAQISGDDSLFLLTQATLRKPENA